jgi:hypothetical protein
MKSTFNSNNQFWTEICSSTGLISKFGTNTSTSSCLTTWECARAQAINDFAVANSYIRPAMQNEIMVLLDKVFKRYPATTD